MADDPYAAFADSVEAPSPQAAPAGNDPYADIAEPVGPTEVKDKPGAIRTNADGSTDVFGEDGQWYVRTPPPDAKAETLGRSFGEAGRAALEGVGSIAEIPGHILEAIDALDRFITPNRIRGPVSPTANIGDALADKAGLPTADTHMERAVNAAGSGISGGLATAGAGALAGAPALAESAAAQALGGGGAGLGGEVAKQQGYGPLGQILASLAGGIAGGVAGAPLTPRATPAVPVDEGIAQAAARQGIDLLPADVSGPTVRRLTGAAAQAPLSASPIINAAKRVLDQGQAAVARQAPEATDAATAGEAVRTGAQNYIQRTSRIGGGLYDRAARRAGDVTIDPVQARQVLDDQIERLKAVPGGGQGLPEAEALRDSLNGRFSVQGIRDMRTEMFVDPALRGSPMDRRLRQVVDAASNDVEQGLRDQGHPEAAAAFKTADAFWKQRLDTIDQVLEPVLGQPGKAKGGEAISKAIDTAAKGDVVRLQRLLGTLPDAERQVATSSFINRLGRATKGNQNDTGDAFSLSTFLSNWSDLTPRAKAVLFSPEQTAALSDVARVANGVREASKYANHSNTAGGIWGNIGALFGIGSVAPHVAGVGLGAQLVAGKVLSSSTFAKMLSSPRFARWLARAPRTTLAPPAYIDRLTRIAQAEPAIANEVMDLKNHLETATNGSAAASAQQPDQERQAPLPQEQP